MATTTEFCENLRLFCQYWDKKDEEKIVGYCRKNLFKPTKLRKADIYRCIKGKLEQGIQVEFTQSRSINIDLKIMLEQSN